MLKKKGESQYLSWILIFGMMVALSFALYNWSIDQAKKTSGQLEASTDPLVCSEIGISIDGICQDHTSLKINLSNTNKMEIEGFLVRTVGLYPEEDDYLDSQTIFMKIFPGDSEKMSILKKGTLSQVQLIPFAKRNNKNIYCEQQSVTKEQNDLKYC